MAMSARTDTSRSYQRRQATAARPGASRLSLWITLAVLVALSILMSDRRPLHAQTQPCAQPITNPIVCENSKPGNPDTEWDIVGAGDTSIQGFATDISVNRGETVSFKVKTDAAAYRLDIYRMGYYGGKGARKVATVSPSARLPQAQPACLEDAATGLVDCGNWAVSASWAVPADAVSGIYFAKLVRTDTGGASHIIFVVRDDASTSDMLFQTSDTTWHAYNNYGGNNLYSGNWPVGRAYKVSYNRPFYTRAGTTEDFVFYAEYPMVRWLEANGYNTSYSTDMDSDRRGALIKNHKVFLSVGHDEYWSGAQRANVEAARAAGVNLAFFSGNEVFWKTRWEASIDGSGTPYRTLVTYKETKEAAPIDPADPPIWTGTWRDPRFSPPADGGRPENALTGTIFTVNRGSAAMTVPAEDGKMRFWRNTSVANLAPGQSATLSDNTVGYEWDEDLDNGARPPGLIRLSTTTVNVPEHLIDFGNTFVPGTATHHLTLYRHSSGALVFGAGTVQWSWGLDPNHDGGPDLGASTPDPRMQQATVNLFADMGVQPGTLQSGLVAASKSTDVTPPSSTITAPASGATVQQDTAVTISGTATDVGGVVGGVEVSTDGGATWHPATGRTSWTYSWKPLAPGTVTIKSRAADDSGNIETPGAGRTVTVNPRACPCSIWPNTAVPDVASANDPAAIEVGVKFKSDIDGYITGVRFYKGTANTGTHIGNLWTSTGTLLATATFVGETASGWQQVLFPAPVPINANLTYVASYHAANGNYATSPAYFANAMDNYPVHALASGPSGGNGVYTYGASAFPSLSFNATNYWVDVVLETSAKDTIPPTVTARTPAPGATKVDPSAPLTATFSEPVTATSISFVVTNPNSVSVPATLTYDAPTRTATLRPNAPLAESTTYTATVSGATDQSGNVMTPVTWSFTTTGPATSIWTNAPTPAVASFNDPNAIEVGVKFRSDIDGYITGVRFYKGTANTGTHIGNLWTSTGTLLATATFTGETASGWQQVLFPAPVPVTANTIYVASYHTDVGGYSVNTGYFATVGTDNYPLHAPANSATSGNGIYAYGASGFPNQSGGGANYWVDVVFSTVNTDTVPPTVTGRTPTSNATRVATTTAVTATFSEPVTAASVSVVLKDAAGATVPAALTYDATTRTAKLQPNTALAFGATYTATVSGAKDAAGNTMAPASWSFTTVTCPCTIWPSTATPIVASANDPTAIEVGVKFRSDIDGYITGVRFYKGTANTGTHIGNLWTSTGTLLATATFTGETASGWQQVLFPAPVPVTANTIYVASYHTDVGGYSADSGTFGTAGVDGWPLHALASGASGGNGVYTYGPSAFPTLSFNATNYWVDAVFSTSNTDTVAPTVAKQTPAPNATKAPTTTSVTATFSEPVTPASVSVVLKDAAGATVPAALTYDATTRTAKLQPTSLLAEGKVFTATVSGAADAAGNVMTAVSWSFTTASCPCTIWQATAVPVTAAMNDPNAIEVGVKFKSDIDGYITGVRFYKGTANTGTHIGNLWTSTGTLLATATFSGETASGWQQVGFPVPVRVTAGTTYIASYHTDVGYYAADGNTLISGVDSWPLHALADGVAGGNGVYAYGPSAFPSLSFNATNYWVDAVFSTSNADTVAPTVAKQTPAPSATKVLTTASVTATFSEPVTPASSISFVLKDAAGVTVPAAMTYDDPTRTATLKPNAALAPSTTYTATVSGAKDAAGNTMAPVSWSFTTITCPCSIWGSTATPAVPSANDPQAIEVGVKFKSDLSGKITGIRFYKGTANTGTHTGSLWTSTGTLLATATFVGETATGWQQVTFATPVQITANTTYVASYYTAAGGYASDGSFFAGKGVDNGPLHALADGVAGGNGVYKYGASGFPNLSFNATNYWVDVVFTP